MSNAVETAVAVVYTILFCIAKNELRVIRFDALVFREDGLIDVPGAHGGWRTFALPPIADPGGLSGFPGFTVDADYIAQYVAATRDNLPQFDNAEAAWDSVRDDYHPTFHP
jgi:hypothetical protein